MNDFVSIVLFLFFYCRNLAIAESADQEMIVCYHPTEDFPYEHSKVMSTLENSSQTCCVNLHFFVFTSD